MPYRKYGVGGKRIYFLLVLLAGVCGLAGEGLAQSYTLDPDKEAAMIKRASVLDNNPDDADAVQQVCTACHSSFQWLSTPRSFGRWEQVFQEMSGYGASPTDEQIDQIVRYFQRNLTIVNVNTSPPDELAPTLQVTDAVANAIVERRTQKKFIGVTDLALVPGVKKTVLQKLGTRLEF